MVVLVKVAACVFISTLSLNAGAHCFKLAAESFGVNQNILMAIAQVESGYNENALNINKNKTFDIGIMQINSIHLNVLSKIGLKQDNLLDPCTNIIVGAWLLKEATYRENGDVWRGVGRYHSATPALAQKYIEKVQVSFGKINGKY